MKLTDAPPSTQSIKTSASCSMCTSSRACRRRTGEGLGGQLVRAALDSARAEGLSVLPFCPFVRGYIEGHPEYVDLVPADQRKEFGL